MEQPGTDGTGSSRNPPPRCSSRSCPCCTSSPWIPRRPRTPSCMCVLFTRNRGELTWPSSPWCICEQSCPQITGSWEVWPFCVTSSKFISTCWGQRSHVGGQCYWETWWGISFLPDNCLITLSKLKSWYPTIACVYVFSLISIFVYYYFLLEYNCFIMLCSFLLYNEVNQLYVYIYPLPLGPPPPPPIPPI